MFQFTVERKIEYVTGTLFEMLRNDLRTVLEARCDIHGTRGSGPNFAACLLCLVACEVAAKLSGEPGIPKSRAIRRFIGWMGDQVGDSRYRDLAGPLFGFFRHGIAHTFLPLAHQGVFGSAVWVSECPQWLGSPEGGARCAYIRERDHLVVRRVSGIVAFQVVPQILYIDVITALDTLGGQLQRGEFDMQLFSRNFDAWKGANERLERWYVNDEERRVLANPMATRDEEEER